MMLFTISFLGPLSRTRGVEPREDIRSEVQSEVSEELEEREEADHVAAVEVESAPMLIEESLAASTVVVLTTKPETVLGSSKDDFGDIGMLNETLIVKTSNNLSDLSEDDLYCNRLADLQLSILNKGYRIPKTGLHSEEARRFYKNVLKAPNSVLNILESGYNPPTVSELPKTFFKDNNKTAKENLSFVRKKGFFLEYRGLLFLKIV